ncbi:hypothetical protein B0H17DRAFT_1324280 [Mycena rosella]|uniref:Uncharacterized protein n=1 Tax=Mycena rosella TaxID=1033263 RepID=A0AAD7H2V0_MYCRO|nr:hypothetical protein B0H17DRAFT_1324280 [Mycena rosella]
MADGDSDMATLFNDNKNWIEDRYNPNEHHQREDTGYWRGSTAAAAKPENSGYNPDHNTRSTMSTSYSDRYHDPPEYRDESQHHCGPVGQDRFRDKPYWSLCSQCYDPRNTHPDYHDWDVLDRDRFAERERENFRRHWLSTFNMPPLCMDDRRAPVENNPPPDARKALRSPDGHPMMPRIVAKCGEDFEGDEDPPSDDGYLKREEERLLRVAVTRSKAHKKGVADPPAAINLCEFLDTGEESAYEKFVFMIQNLAAVPTDFCTEGEAYVMKHQQQLECNWWIKTRGAPRQSRMERLRTGNGSNALRTNTAAGFPPAVPGLSFESTVPLSPIRSTPETVTPDIKHRGYLGHLPPNPDDVTPLSSVTCDFRAWHGLPNMLVTAAEVVHHYLTVFTAIRNMLGNCPRISGDSAHMDDVLSFQTVIALGPFDHQQFAHQWWLFYETFILMFSIPGLFDHIHGIDDAAIRRIEVFARAHRNTRNNIANLNNVGWANSPAQLPAP